MFRYVFYAFPLLFCTFTGGVTFVVSNTLSRAGFPAWVISLAFSLHGLAYALAAYGVGRRTRSENATRIMIRAGLAVAATSVFGMAASLWFLRGLPVLLAQFACSGLAAAASGSYVTAFLIFTRELESGREAGLIRSTSFYTFSWSAGAAAGPFICGLFSPFSAYAVNTVIGLFVAGFTIQATRSGWVSGGRKERPKPLPDLTYSKMPNLVHLGWVCGAACALFNILVNAIVPFRAAELNTISAKTAGFVLAAYAAVRAFLALTVPFWPKFWMYRKWALPAGSLVGAAGLGLVGFGRTPCAFYLAAALLGVWSLLGYYCFVIFSLADPDKAARYASINETLVGICSIAGPFAGALAVKGHSGIPFLAAAPVLVVAAVVQLWMLQSAFCRHRPSEK